MKNKKYIFVIGGVLSGLGKGIAVSSIGMLLKSRGFRVTALKIDPYVNVDAGTMNPTEHGEVFVTQDGLETDQDIGNYERFFNTDLTRDNYMTTGAVYQSVIEKERNLEYKGRCVEVVPHIPEEVIRRIKLAGQKTKSDIILIEIGGTVGEYQNLLFLEAARMMKLEMPEDVQHILVSYLPIPSKIGEMKTKPTQYAVRTLNSAGIQPDFLLCRSEKPLDKPRSEKLATFCNMSSSCVFSAVDVDNIYKVPLNFDKDKLPDRILKKFNLKPRGKNLRFWKQLVNKMTVAKKKVRIGIVGKYFATGNFTLADSYISVIEAIRHAAWSEGYQPELIWLNSEEYEKNPALVSDLKSYDGVIVPQGWGSRGSEGKISVIKFLREKKIPYLGLCYGMQMAVIEFARNVAGLKKANSLESDPNTPHPVIYIMPEQEKYLAKKQYGGTIRLGDWPCRIKPKTRTAQAYGPMSKVVQERHRHRYEFNNTYRKKLESKGLVISGTSPDGKLVEAIELPDHPFFVGSQFHPEYQSRPEKPHPLFVEFVKASTKKS
ncbi:CTP synthase [Patescibacteria group bacterium]|nr:CTP synthase [Patescibacteria group bacterium]MBU1890112.1 CTP synthase [Patescibacteria group bacterium]